jgi:hypothetical protein
MEKRPALGKGLSALIPDAPPAAPSRAPLELDVDQIEPSEFQPRLHIDDGRRFAPTASSSRWWCGASAPIGFRSSPASAAGGPRSAPG